LAPQIAASALQDQIRQQMMTPAQKLAQAQAQLAAGWSELTTPHAVQQWVLLNGQWQFITKYVADLNATMPTTVQGFADLILAQDASTASGQNLIQQLYALFPAFQTVADAAGSTASSIQTDYSNLQKWLDANLLSSSLSPLTIQQQLGEAQSQYVENLMKAQGGDQSAINAFGSFADTYEQLAIQEFGRASPQFRAIFDAIQAQGKDVLAGSPVDLTAQAIADLKASLQQQITQLNGELQQLNAGVTVLTQATNQGSQQVAAAVDTSAATISNAIGGASSTGAPLARV
jgi:methyl-accepting chemotaxis protein